MNSWTISEEYENRIKYFLAFVKRNVPNKNGLYLCPCMKYLNES